MKRILPLLAVAVCLSVPLSAATRFPALVEGFANPKVGASGPVSNVTFSIGHLKLTLASGNAAPVTAADQKVAIFFTGQGSFTYTSDDPVELPILNKNVRAESNLKNENGVISGQIDEIVLYAGGVPLPEIAAGSGAPLDLKAHQELFGRVRGVTPIAHSMIQQIVGAPFSRFVAAEIVSGRDTLIYEYDPIESQQEALVSMRSSGSDDPETKKNLYPATLSMLPIGRSRKTPPTAPFLLTDLTYALTADGDNAKLDVTETIRRNTPLQVLRFDQASSWGVKAGARRRYFHVLSVTDEKGHSLPFSHEHGNLIVDVEGLSDPMKLRFNIEGDFLIRPENASAWQLGVASWFPQPDLNGQFYTVHSTVKVQKPWIALAPGTTVRRFEDGNFNGVENVIDQPVQFAVVHAGKYEVTEEKRGELTVRVASYAGKNERAAKQLTNLAYTIIDYYQWFLGPFPFSEFNIIQVPTWGYGQAPPATMFITNEAFNSLTGAENRFFSQGINERFAHEIAHQYWGHVVKMPSEEEQWLTESFAEYTAALAIKKFQGDGKYDKLVQTWKVHAKENTAVAPIALANHIGGDPMNANIARTYLLYAKGPYLLYTLHKELGDNQFLTFMKSYQRSFRWKFGTTKDVAGLLTFITKKDYEPFLDKYYWGTAMPD